MATNTRNDAAELPPPGETREWLVFAYKSFARIAARKHGIAAPSDDLDSLSDEELEKRLTVVRELAHLPPA